MYSYKINKSYTVYVNYSYVNDCVKACKKTREYETNKTYEKVRLIKGGNITALSVGAILEHKQFGRGELINADNSGIIYVAFADKTIRFLYPDAINKGFLSLIN